MNKSLEDIEQEAASMLDGIKAAVRGHPPLLAVSGLTLLAASMAADEAESPLDAEQMVALLSRGMRELIANRAAETTLRDVPVRGNA